MKRGIILFLILVVIISLLAINLIEKKTPSVDHNITGLSIFSTPNEPVGHKKIVDRPFNTTAQNNTDRGPTGGSEDWESVEWDDVNFKIVQDSTAPLSPSNVVQITYPLGLII